jgi:hypothetical protein
MLASNSLTRMAAARASVFVSLKGPSSTNNLAGWAGKTLAREPAGAKAPFSCAIALEAAEGWLGGRQTTAHKIYTALEKAGAEFIDENGGRPGVRFRKHQRSK